MSSEKSKHEEKRERLLRFVVALFNRRVISAISKQQLVELASVLNPPTTEVVAGRDLAGLRKSNQATAKEVFRALCDAHIGLERSIILGRELVQCRISVLYECKPNGGDLLPLSKIDDDLWNAAFDALQLPAIAADPKKTGGLYAVADVMNDSPAKDGEWFTQQVTVEGKRIVVRVNGKVTTDYTEPDDVERPADLAGRLLSHGTIALQAHDPGSEVHIRKILLKPLP
jgi:hypothetical protein